MRFEAICPTPVGGIPPHLDVEFTGTQVRSLVVESRFTETYRRHTRRRMKRVYISKPLLWPGLPSCEALAKLIYNEQKGRTSFEYLDAPQLLKHILGLNYESRFKEEGFTLLYLWYEIPSLEADKHRSEIESFRKAVGQDIDFQASAYKELFRRIGGIAGIDESYISYLRVRYFPTSLHRLFLTQWLFVQRMGIFASVLLESSVEATCVLTGFRAPFPKYDDALRPHQASSKLRNSRICNPCDAKLDRLG